VIRCEVTKDIPADDELVAMLTVSESAPGVSSSPTDAAATAAGAADVPPPSPVVVPRSPISQSDDGGSGVAEVKMGVLPSSRPVVSVPSENTDCVPPCPVPTSSHHNVVNNARKKDRTVSHPNLATSAALSSDLEHHRRSFCK